MFFRRGSVFWIFLRSHLNSAQPQPSFRETNCCLVVLSLFVLLCGSVFFPLSAGFCGVKFVARPKAGDVAYVSGAAGATGLVACHTFKNLGCRVIGSAGTKEPGTGRTDGAGRAKRGAGVAGLIFVHVPRVLKNAGTKEVGTSKGPKVLRFSGSLGGRKDSLREKDQGAGRTPTRRSLYFPKPRLFPKATTRFFLTRTRSFHLLKLPGKKSQYSQ